MNTAELLNFKGKKGLIFGIANEKSIAYEIAKLLSSCGAEMILSYQNEILKKRIDPIALELNAKTYECDLTKDESVCKLFDFISSKEGFDGKIDFIVHSVAFANKNNLTGKFYNLSREDFATAMNASCYSFIDVVKRASEFMSDNSSIITLSYIGSERVVPNYNIMGVAKAALECSVRYLANDLGEKGVRVNSISSGPIKTLAASAISGFSKILNHIDINSPLKRNVTTNDVAKTALYLLSDLSSGVTGENIYVDSGYHVVGMPKEIS